MKKFYNIRLLLLLCLLVSFGMLSSCEDDEDKTPGNGQVEVLSFGPTGARHGEKIKFIGHNLDKVESIQLPGVTLSKAQFTSQSAELIELVIPATATEGKVVLKVAGGEDITTKTVLSFEVPVTIATMPAQAKPGTNITLTGEFLTWVEGVKFGDDPDTVKTFVSQTMTELVLTVPMDAKTGLLTVFTGGTEPLAIETENELVVELPVPTALAPATVANGANLSITGANLDLVKEVIFTGVGAAKVSSFVSQSATELVVVVPANAVKGKLKLVAISGVEVSTAQELNLVLPAVTALSPNPIKHGENLTLSGTNLDLVAKIIFTRVGNDTVKVFVSRSPTQLVVKVPDNASKGTLKLLAKSGATVTTSQVLDIVLPAITTLAPAPVDPGKDLTINGSNLDLVKSIEFQGGTTVSTFVSQTPTRIVVKVPMNAKKGALKLTTHSNYAVATEAQVTIILPVLTAVTPEPVIAGNYLTLSGTELNLVKSVVFADNVLVSSFVAQSNTQIVLAVPATAKSGALKLITHSDFEVATGKQAQIGTAAPNISYYIFENALHAEWQKWGGWGTTLQDLANEEQVSRGAKAIKLSYNDAYGALQLHPNKANVLAGYSHVVLYARGGAADSRLALQVKSSAGSYLADVPFNVKAGEYKLIEIPISALGDVSGGIGELFIKNYGTNPNTVYIDDLGLR